MQTRHPITERWVDLTNKQWRCIKLAIPTDCTQWQLMVAERNYDWLFKLVGERSHDAGTLKWLSELLTSWQRNVLSTPSELRAWYVHICTFYQLDTIASTSDEAGRIKAKLAKLTKQKAATTFKMVKAIKKQIAELAETNRRKRVARRKK